MRKVKEVLRLRFALGLQQNQIARSCAIGQATVHRYLQKASAAGLTWPLPENLDDRRLEELGFPAAVGRPNQITRSLPDFAQIRRQLQTHKHLTLQLVWEEYRETQPDGYAYSRFCELYDRWSRNQDVVLRQEHRAGEKMFVDWAGDTIPIHDPHTGEAIPASLFVAVLGASTYTFARATISQDLGNWVDCHVAAFEYCLGTPKLVVPDNPRTGVDRACRYEPDLNRTYHEMAMHYGVAVMPARPRKPRDKAKVENAVLLAERWIIAALRHRRFQALPELNGAISELLEKLNHRPFRKREGSRASLFAELDQPALQPLPAERYILAHWKTVRASIDYPVEVDRHYYSVPYQLAGPEVGGPLYRRYRRDPAGRKASSFARPQQRRLSPHHRVRAHAQESPGAPGMDTLAVDPLGRRGRRGYRRSRPHDPRTQASPGNGLPRLPGRSESGENLHQAKAGSRQPARRPTAGLLLSESEIDSETLARPPTCTRFGGRRGALWAGPSP